MADEQTNTEQNNQEQNTRDYEADARKTGWRPQTEYQGDPAKWLPAKEWVEKGETFIPFLQSSNRELKSQITARDDKLQEMDRQLRMANKAIEELKDMTTEAAVDNLETQKESLIEQIAAAHEAGDVRAELRLRDQYADVGEQIRQKKAGGGAPSGENHRTTEEPPPQRRPADDPIFQGWVSDNPWFRDDPALAGAAIAILNKNNGDADFRALSPRERLDRVTQEIQRRFMPGNTRRNAPSRVEGSRTDGSGGGGGRGKTYEDLPPEAKAQCDKFATRFVGKVNGKGEIKFKTLADYQSNYAKDYFAEDWGQRQIARTQ